MRAIDADALWRDITTAFDDCEDILEIIDRQPTIEPEQRWIPCSEKHPDKDGWYLVSLGNEWDENGFGRVNADKKIYDSMVRISSYKNGAWFHGMVAAWMPMPNAYKGGKE